ncbi:MAG: Fic family protein [bacterium]
MNKYEKQIDIQTDDSPAGYYALIKKYNLKVVLPETLSFINNKHIQYQTEGLRVFTKRYKPEDTLDGHLKFALKYEGVDLYVLKSLFNKIDLNEVSDFIKKEPTGSYNRRIWFLYEWLHGKQLNIENLKSGNYVHLIDEKLQYGGNSQDSKRHRIKNNLPGVKEFCPLIKKTKKLESFIGKDLIGKLKTNLGKVHPDILKRTAAFLLLSDSKASYLIEGEQPTPGRAQKWANILGLAGQKKLTLEELLRLQKILIEDTRFIKLGLRKEGGFVGSHDRSSLEPIPELISAKWQDLGELMEGLIKAENKMQVDGYNAVLTAASIAFGFVFIHPFADGNGRIHRYLINDILTRSKFTEGGIIFPASHVILERINEYKEVLESYSLPRLELIEWKPTENMNINVINESIDLYRYFDATKQAEFLFSCIEKTIEKVLPEEIEYLKKYDKMKNYINNNFEMDDRTIDQLINFLKQNDGSLSQRAKSKEFKILTEKEGENLENNYREIFHAIKN